MQQLRASRIFDTGYFWFFNASSVEMIVKVVDTRSLNAYKCVFACGLTNGEVPTRRPARSERT